MTKTEILAVFAELLEHAKVHTDHTGAGNADPHACAFNGVRSAVHAELQSRGAPPEPHPDDEGDAEMHHMRQKSYFKKLWQRTDELVAQAGLTEKGQVS